MIERRFKTRVTLEALACCAAENFRIYIGPHIAATDAPFSVDLQKYLQGRLLSAH